MANMSYCKFENTLEDLRDCMEALDKEGTDNLSGYEKKSAFAIIKMCKRIAEDYSSNTQC
jgi:hypothetical protein